MRRILRRQRPDGSRAGEPAVGGYDLVAIARARIPRENTGAHAILDEVERGRRRRAETARQDSEAARQDAADAPVPQGHRAAPGAFSPLPLERYIEWAEAFLAQGGRLAGVTEAPYAVQGFLLAVRDFTTGGECGAESRQILVPPGICHLGGALGHSTLYTWDDAGTARCTGPHSVRAFSDPEFRRLPGYDDLLQEQRDEAARYEDERERERAARAGTSDLTAYVLEP